MKTLDCNSSGNGKIEFQTVCSDIVPITDYKSLMIDGAEFAVTKRFVCPSSKYGAMWQQRRGKVEIVLKVQKLTK